MKHTKDDVPAWESLIGAKIELHLRTHKDLKIKDARKRNAANATKNWRRKNMEHYKAKQKEWLDAHPDRVAVYRERNKKNVKRWAEEHPERVRELNRKSDAKRAKSPKRIAWNKEYSQRPEVRERRRLRDRERNKTPERKAYMRERDRRRRAAKKLENK